MNEVFLIALFLVNGNVVMHPNFVPLQAPSMEECLNFLPQAEQIVESNDVGVPFVVGCIDSQEAFDNLSKELLGEAL